jgi:SAM-dependent methyltransferase
MQWISRNHNDINARMDYLYSPSNSFRKAFKNEMNFGIWKDKNSTFKTAHMDLILKLLNQLEIKGNVLAVGCSTGTEILLVKENYRNVVVAGVEVVLSQVHVARERTGVIIYHASASEIPIESGSQDVIIAIDCAYHFFPSRIPFLKECKRLLRPKGNFGTVDLYFNLW